MTIEVSGWQNADEDCALENIIFGGFFEKGMRWDDYINKMDEKDAPYLEAMRKAVIQGKIKESGYWHQYSDYGCPVFSDGKKLEWSMRGWGDLLAAIWSEEENIDYTYMDFYC